MYQQAEASPAVIALIAQGNAASISQKKQRQKLSKNDKQCLQTIMATIQSQLASDEEPAESDHVPESEPAPQHESETEQPQVESPPATPPKVSTPIFETMEVDEVVSTPVADTSMVDDKTVSTPAAETDKEVYEA